VGTFRNWPPPSEITVKRTGKPTFKKPKKPKRNGSTELVLDTFTDTNGVALTAHTPDVDSVGTGWVQTDFPGVTGGIIEIQSNQARMVGAAGDKIGVALINSGESNVIVTATITLSAGDLDGTQGIVFRGIDDANHFRLVRINSTTVELRERVAAADITRGSVTGTFTSSATFEFKAVLSGTSITCTVDGGNEIAITSSVHQANTAHGFTAIKVGGSNRFNTVDDFTVTE